MALLTAAQMKAYVETDLADEDLQRIIDADDAEIVRLYGDPLSVTDRHATGCERTSIVLRQPVQSVTSIVETRFGWTDVTTTLDASDYRVWPNGQLDRLGTGTHPYGTWGDIVEVTYTPESMVNQRTLALVQLCKLALAYSGRQSMTIGSGNYQETVLPYAEERAKILRSIAPRAGVVFA